MNLTDDRVLNPADTLNKYVYGGNNPLKYIDPDGKDITYFYDQGGIAGHAILFAYNQATGDSALESFGPSAHAPVWKGESNFEMGSFTSADDLRSTVRHRKMKHPRTGLTMAIHAVEKTPACSICCGRAFRNLNLTLGTLRPTR